MNRALLSSLVLAAALAGCGGEKAPSDPVQQLPSENGVRQAVAAASAPKAADFPPASGRTLQDLANQMKDGPTLALASSVLTTGPNRIAFGVIDQEGQPVYGPTVLYVASTPGAPAKGPYAAPADVLLTQARYRSKQAATASDPFVAVYGARLPFDKAGRWTVLSATRTSDGSLVGTRGSVNVTAPSQDPIPEVGQKAPAVHTDTLASAKGDVSKIDTRVPPSDMHDVDFAEVVGKKPVALLFSTPQLCSSRVCGPVTDIELQMKAKYGDRMTFIHEEVYQDNDPNKGLRAPLLAFHLRTEPWLFVVDRTGKITARLEGSIGVREFERAVKSGL